MAVIIPKRSLEACAAALDRDEIETQAAGDAAMESFVGDDGRTRSAGRQARKPEFDFERVLRCAGIA
jgi:hypothetical protein